ncbi:MAG: hypothetical protein ACI9LM_003378, partial [Alteromonadaceae bacterium]
NSKLAAAPRNEPCLMVSAKIAIARNLSNIKCSLYYLLIVTFDW